MRAWHRGLPRCGSALDVLAPDRTAGTGALYRAQDRLPARRRSSAPSGEIRIRLGAVDGGTAATGAADPRSTIVVTVAGDKTLVAAVTGASPSPRMSARGVPTGTFAPGWTRSVSITPLVKTSTSITPFSVSTSAIDVAAPNDVAGLLSPGDQGAGGHIRPELWHDEFSHGASSSPERRLRSFRPGARPRPRDAWHKASAPRHCKREPPVHQDRKTRAP